MNNLRGHVERLLCKGDFHLIFDRYHEYSTHIVKVTDASGLHQPKAHTELPPHGVVLTVTDNKQVKDIICTELMQYETFRRESVHKHKFMIEGRETTVELSFTQGTWTKLTKRNTIA